LDQALAQLPEGCGRRFALRLLRGHAAAAVVEVHPSQALQLRSRRAVDSCGSSLLLELKKKREKKNPYRSTERDFIVVILTAVL